MLIYVQAHTFSFLIFVKSISKDCSCFCFIFFFNFIHLANCLLTDLKFSSDVLKNYKINIQILFE